MNQFTNDLVIATAIGYAKKINSDTRVVDAMLVLENLFAAIDQHVLELDRPDAYLVALNKLGDELGKKGLRKFW